MSSALRPLTSSPQNPSSSNQLNKAMHPQGAPTYGQPGHMAQGMVNLHPNTNLAHAHPNTQQHHYLNAPNAAGHYMNQSMGQIPASNHPVPNPSSGSVAVAVTGGGPIYNAPPPKAVPPYMGGGGYQHQPAQNMGHSVNANQSTLPPVSQSLPPSGPPHAPPTANLPTSVQQQQQQQQQQQPDNNLSSTPSTTATSVADRPQSNGTQETKVSSKLGGEPQLQQQSYVPAVKEKPLVATPVGANLQPQTAQPPSVTSEKPPEKPKPPSPPEPTNRPEATKPPDTPPSNAPTPPMSNSESNSNSPTLIEKPVVPQPSTSPAIVSGQTEKVEAGIEDLREAVDGKKVEEDKGSSPVPQPDSSDYSNASFEEKTEDSTKEPQTNSEVPTEDTEKTSIIKPQEQSPAKKDPSPAKTIPPPPATSAPRTPTRKSKPPKPEDATPKQTKEVKTAAQKSPSTGKAKRQRIRTQPYQSPLPEIEIITKITASASSTPRGKSSDDKLIVFYKNEFLAVRNAEGSFYLCQAVQNIYKSSSKIKIRWLSQDKADKSGEIYTPDFYDLTDFDCILTNLSMRRVDKGKYRLPNAEKERTESILNRSLAVEKGEVTSPSLTEEHPDGLDLSLYKAEDQIKKTKRSPNRKRGRKPSKSPVKKSETPTKKSPEAPKVRRVAPKPTPPPKRGAVPAKKPPPSPPKRAAPPTRSSEPAKKAPTAASSSRSGRGVAGKRKAAGGGGGEKPKTSPVVDHKKAKVLAKIGRKTATVAAVSAASKVAASKKAAGKAAKPVVASTSKKSATATKTSKQAAKLPTTRSGKRATRK